ncbi:MAG: tetratricopeptide repeat protein [Deltaproteobacteria bacterium]|nr:tetratricopeptide repeat protein [Deltaproteobacteria bacterium]
MLCRNCGANISQWAENCPHCASDPRRKSGSPRTSLRLSSKLLTAIVVIISLAVISALVYYLARQESARPRSRIQREDRTGDAQKGLPAGPEVSSAGTTLPSAASYPEDLREGYKAFKEGDYGKASALLRRALNDDPSNEALKGNLAQSLFFLGREELKKRDFRRAKEFFYDAGVFKEDPAFLKGAAYAEMGLGELEAASGTLERIKDDSEARGLLKDVYMRLGQTYWEGGNVEGAALYLEKALSLDPSDGELRSALEKMRGERASESGFTEKKGSHFIVRFEGGENAVTGHLIGILLEEAYYRIGSELGYYPEDKITAVLYSGERFRDTTRAPSWAGALFDGRIKIPAGGVTEKTSLLEKVVFHEYTHAVIFRVSKGRAPVWLNEGLAQYFEEKKDEGAPFLKDVLSGEVSLKPLEGSFTGFSSGKALIAYALSLSAAEYLIREFGIFSARKILEGLGQGNTMDGAFSSSIYLSYAEFEQGWLESARRRQGVS